MSNISLVKLNSLYNIMCKKKKGTMRFFFSLVDRTKTFTMCNRSLYFFLHALMQCNWLLFIAEKCLLLIKKFRIHCEIVGGLDLGFLAFLVSNPKD